MSGIGDTGSRGRPPSSSLLARLRWGWVGAGFGAIALLGIGIAIAFPGIGASPMRHTVGLTLDPDGLPRAVITDCQPGEIVELEIAVVNASDGERGDIHALATTVGRRLLVPCGSCLYDPVEPPEGSTIFSDSSAFSSRWEALGRRRDNSNTPLWVVAHRLTGGLGTIRAPFAKLARDRVVVEHTGGPFVGLLSPEADKSTKHICPKPHS